MSDKQLPKPEEIQKEFEEFVQKRFGGQVHVLTQELPFSGMAKPKKVEGNEKKSKKSEKLLEFDFKFKPKDVKQYLDRFIIGQDDAKKALAIAVCDHYNYITGYLKNSSKSNLANYAKQNVLVLGPTGVGKTFMVKQIAKLIDVPFVKADATKFSETGYMGANVDDLIKDLVSQAGGDLDKAQFGIIYIDEIDKLASVGGHHGRDISGRGVQLGLLKLMEETDVDLRASHDPASQMQAFLDMQHKGKIEKQVVNTKFILFIASGAFPKIENIIAKRLNRNAIGFSQDQYKSPDVGRTELLTRANTSDFVEFGFEPEFIGRLPVRVACEALDQEKLFTILKHSEASIIHQYIESFAAYGIDVKFTDDALEKIAELAANEQTGARSLMTVCEGFLRGFKFELPSSPVSDFSINAETVMNPNAALAKLLAEIPAVNKSAIKQIRSFEESFLERYQMRVNFSPRACSLICLKSAEIGVSIASFCEELLSSYEHGLKLIQQNTGISEFLLDNEVVENPKQALEKMVKDSYNRA